MKAVKTSIKVSGKEYLIDTNIIVEFFRGDPNIVQLISDNEIIIPSIVVGELYFGAYSSSYIVNQAKRLREVAYFVEKHTVLKVTENTSNHYGQIKTQLKAKGTPIPENDIWIAAISKEHNLPLITKDNHFQQISNIETLKW